jgi:hypothetical protein
MINLTTLAACLAPLVGLSPPSGEAPELVVGKVVPPIVGVYSAGGPRAGGSSHNRRPTMQLSSTLDAAQQDRVIVRLTVAWMAGMPLRAVTRQEANVAVVGVTQMCLEGARADQ